LVVNSLWKAMNVSAIIFRLSVIGHPSAVSVWPIGVALINLRGSRSGQLSSLYSKFYFSFCYVFMLVFLWFLHTDGFTFQSMRCCCHAVVPAYLCSCDRLRQELRLVSVSQAYYIFIDGFKTI